jgi:polysaccharide deacetylase family sporulation protein PdaB
MLALVFVVCVAVGMGFVLGRRTELARKEPALAPADEVVPEEIVIAEKTISPEQTVIPEETVSEEVVLDEVLVDEPVSEMIAVVPKSKMPIFYVETKEPAVALTFDISWGQKQVLGVLEILREKNVKSTFFLSGPWAKRYPHLVEEIAKAGHDIGSHGDAHVDLSHYSRDEVAKNIKTAHEDLLATAGRVSPYFRPPNGDYDDVVVDTARSLGYETVIWAVDSLDWKNPGVDFMLDRVLGRTFEGAIVLMHASDSSEQIQDALPLIIDGLREKGFRLMSLSELSKLGIPARRDPR